MRLTNRRYRRDGYPIDPTCDCATCAAGYSRAYLHYLFRLRETTGARIVTQHNLAYLQQLMAAMRAAIDAGRLPDAIAAARAGAPPWAM